MVTRPRPTGQHERYGKLDRVSGRLVVLESFRAPRPTTNPYVVQLWNALRHEPGLQVLTFSWRTALLRRYDVVHLHWPEILVAGRTRPRALAAQLRFAVLLLRWHLLRTPVVRTVHNLRPHETTSATARFLLARLDRLTTVRVHLAAGTPAGPVPHRVVLHGDYTDWYASQPVLDPVPGRVATVGLVRAYKQVDRLVTAFRGADLPSAGLQVVGAAPDPAVAAAVRDAAGGDPRVDLVLRHVDDAGFVAAVTAAELVALPYRELHNSGSALAALSLGRPVLVPDTATTRELAAEVGEPWVRRYAGELTPQALQAAVAAGVPAGSPDLSRRRWTVAGAAHREAFELARARRRARPHVGRDHPHAV